MSLCDDWLQQREDPDQPILIEVVVRHGFRFNVVLGRVKVVEDNRCRRVTLQCVGRPALWPMGQRQDGVTVSGPVNDDVRNRGALIGEKSHSAFTGAPASTVALRLMMAPTAIRAGLQPKCRSP